MGPPGGATTLRSGRSGRGDTSEPSPERRRTPETPIRVHRLRFGGNKTPRRRTRDEQNLHIRKYLGPLITPPTRSGVLLRVGRCTNLTKINKSHPDWMRNDGWKQIGRRWHYFRNLWINTARIPTCSRIFMAVDGPITNAGRVFPINAGPTFDKGNHEVCNKFAGLNGHFLMRIRRNVGEPRVTAPASSPHVPTGHRSIRLGLLILGTIRFAIFTPPHAAPASSIDRLRLTPPAHLQMARILLCEWEFIQIGCHSTTDKLNRIPAPLRDRLLRVVFLNGS